jgi:hypothetical protein
MRVKGMEVINEEESDLNKEVRKEISEENKEINLNDSNITKLIKKIQKRRKE